MFEPETTLAIRVLSMTDLALDVHCGWSRASFSSKSGAYNSNELAQRGQLFTAGRNSFGSSLYNQNKLCHVCDLRSPREAAGVNLTTSARYVTKRCQAHNSPARIPNPHQTLTAPFSSLQLLNNTAIMTTAPGASISKRRKFVADGVFYAELNEFFQRELAEEGYSGVEVRVTPTVTDISMLLPSVPIPLFLTYVQSSAQHTPKKSLANKGAASASSHRSSRNALSSLKTPSPSMPPKSRTVVSLLWLNVNLSATNCSMVWLCGEPVMVC